MGLLFRSIFFDLVRVFLLALLAITSIFVLGGLAQEASRQGVGPEHLALVIPLLLPGMLPFTVPATTLFAVSVVYGRMSGDNEITAVKAAGIPLRMIVWPALLLGLLLSGIIMSIYVEFIPHTHHRLRSLVLNNFESVIYTRLRQSLSFKEPKVPYCVFVKNVQGRVLVGPVFKALDDDGKEKAVIMADTAELHVDLDNNVIQLDMLDCKVTQANGQSFNSPREIVPWPLPNMNESRMVRARERSMSEILERRAAVVSEMAETGRKLDALQQKLDRKQRGVKEAEAAKPPVPPLPPGAEVKPPRNLEADLKGLQVQLETLKRELGELDVEWAMRPALALGCFFFALIGCPVAIWFQKRDYLSNFVTCFLPIVVVNYPLLMLAMQLGKSQKFDPTFGMWLGNGLLGLAGLVILRWVSKH